MRGLIAGAILFTSISGALEIESYRAYAQRARACGAGAAINQMIPAWGSLPIAIEIGESVPEEAVAPIYRAAAQWERALGEKAFEVRRRDRLLPWLRPAATISWNGGGVGVPNSLEQAKTTTLFRGHRIDRADIFVNAVGHKFTFGGGLKPGYVDFESLMVHELGHELGLGHGPSGGVMEPTLGESLARREVDRRSAAAASCFYAHSGLRDWSPARAIAWLRAAKPALASASASLGR
jgi:hypothetical protein